MLRSLGLAVLFVGCTETHNGSGIVATSKVETFDIPGAVPTAFDVLFVVDDSPAMATFTDRVIALGPALERATNLAPSGMLDLHVAAIKATGDGAFDVGLIDGAFVIDVHAPDGTRTQNFDGSLGTAIARLLATGAASTGPSQPLEVARRALGTGNDFIRTTAKLAIVIVTATDDASPDAPESYARFLHGMHTDPNDVIVTTIDVGPAPRLTQLVAQFPSRSTTVDLAAGDLNQGFDLLDALQKETTFHPCLKTPADVDPTAPGAQYDCALATVREDGVETVLAPCDAGFPGACWRLAVDAACTPSVALDVRGFAGTWRPRVRGQCVVP
jgi:hypothetical protein